MQSELERQSNWLLPSGLTACGGSSPPGCTNCKFVSVLLKTFILTECREKVNPPVLETGYKQERYLPLRPIYERVTHW